MSLVAYGSSDESDSEGAPAVGSAAARGLFSVLPAPKNPRSTAPENHYGPSKETKTQLLAGARSSHEEPVLPPTKVDLFSSLPKPKKRSEPVKITAPEIQRRDVSTKRRTCHLLSISPGTVGFHLTPWRVSFPQSDSDDDEPAKKKIQHQVMGEKQTVF